MTLALDPPSAADRLAWSLKLYGAAGTARLAASKVARRLRRQASDDAYTEWRDRLCDRRLNVETAAPVSPEALALSPEDEAARAAAVEYRPTSAADAAVMLSRLPIDRPATHFVDLGCGKGRVLALARSMGFAAVTGVEFSAPLAEAARRNLVDCSLGGEAKAEVVVGDAAAFEPPAGPLVVYLFNPFGPAVLGPAVGRLESSLEADPRECWVVYANALHRDCFGRRWQAADAGDDWWAVYRWGGA